MGFVSRGFVGRPEAREGTGLLPPGQYDIGGGFPVLSAGPTPRTSVEDWDFTISGEVDEPERLTWQEFQDLPREEVTVDIHCVTRWSKFNTTWSGVSLDTLLDRVETSADYVLAFCDGGYTTNLPLEDVTGGRAWTSWSCADRSAATSCGMPSATRRCSWWPVDRGSRRSWRCSITTLQRGPARRSGSCTRHEPSTT